LFLLSACQAHTLQFTIKSKYTYKNQTMKYDRKNNNNNTFDNILLICLSADGCHY